MHGGHQFKSEVNGQTPCRKTRISGFAGTLFFAGFLLITASAVGQAYAQVPGSLVPGRQQERAAPNIQLLTPAPVAPGVGRQVAPENSNAIQFVLKSISVEGNKVIPDSDVRPIWEPLLNQEVNLQTLYDIANAITALYVERGYALSFAFIPEQKISGGDVVVRVVEGFIDQVDLVPAGVTEQDLKKYFGRSVYYRIQKQANKLLASKPLRTADLEKYLLLINQHPGVQAQATFSASKATPSASHLVLNVSYTPWTAGLSIDNRMASSLGRWSTGVSATMNAGFTGADQISVSRSCGINCGVYNATSFSWQDYTGDGGLQLGLSWTMSSEKPLSGVLAPLEFNGGNQEWALNATYPVIKTRQQMLDIGGAFKIADNKTKTFAGTLTEDHVRTAELFGSYNILDRTGAVNYARLSLVNGLPILSSTEKSDTNKSRTTASGKFTNLNLSVIRNQALFPSIPMMQGVSLYIAGQGQYAVSNPLLSVSQCFYGGSDFGRGYENGAQSGDHCLTGLVEVRRDWQAANVGMQAYGFMDAGYLRRKGALAAGEVRATGAQSYGAGFRLSKSNWMQGDMQLAIPLRESATSNGKGTPELFLKLTLQY